VTARAGGATLPPADSNRRALRRRLRALRRSLSPDERRAAQSALLRNIRALPAFRSARRIGIFVAFDGEPDLTPLRERPGGRQFFVPILRGDGMRFARLAPGMPTRRNAFGLVEPAAPRYIDRRNLDLVLTPLVGFTDEGLRLGVGGGYYDRCFSFLRGRTAWRRPKLLGVAFSCQRLPRLDAEAWDVPLWGIVTEAGARVFGGDPA